MRRLSAAVAVVGLVITAWSSPASAHAVLLRTDPSPQSTVASSPAAVNLFFSEAVEAGNDDVRVFDVNGRRVDTGSVHRSDGNRQVSVEVPHLADGTYTVTWRAVSADTHPVRGGFVFYVGHPSSISPVAIDAGRGASHAVGFAFGVQRFCWFAALGLLVGVVVLRRWAWTPALRASDLSESDAASHFRGSFTRWIVGAWVVLLVATVAALAFQSAAVSGVPFISALTSARLSGALHSSFGRLWALELVLLALLAAPVAGLARPGGLLRLRPDLWIMLGGVLVWAMCVVSGLQGHARTDTRPALAVASVALHLAAVSAWAGGLAALVLVAGPSWRRIDAASRPGALRRIVVRFSAVAAAGLVVVAITGTVNTIAAFAHLGDLWRTTYGKLVAAKMGLLAVALVLAARHRFVTPRRLAGADGRREVGRFSSSAAAELAVLAGAVAVAAGLVTTVPGRTLALAANGPVNAEHKAGDYTVQLIVDPTRPGRNDVHVTFVGASGLAAGEVATTTVALTPPAGAVTPLAMRLIGPGHFVGEADLPSTGRYRVGVQSPQASTTFSFTVRKGA